MASQGLEDGKSVTLVSHQGLVQPGEGGEPGGEVVHLTPPSQHLRSCSRASIQQRCSLGLAICKKVVLSSLVCHCITGAALVQFGGVALVQFGGVALVQFELVDAGGRTIPRSVTAAAQLWCWQRNALSRRRQGGL